MECGSDLESVAEECEACARSEELGYQYCTACGRRTANYIEPPNEYRTAFDRLSDICSSVSTAIVAIMLIVGVVAIFMYFGDTFAFLADRTYPIFVVLPMMIDLFDMEGATLQWYFVAIAAIAITAVAWSFWRSWKSISDDSGMNGLPKAPLFTIGSLLVVSLFVSIATVGISALFGVDLNIPMNGNVLADVFSLLNAAVYEELIVRVLLLGIPMLIVAIIARRKEVPLWRYPMGGFGITPFAIVFLISSSVIFGLGHYDGWGLAKVLPATVSGLMMGYVFIRFGLYASITLHFATDYAMALGWIAGDVGTAILGLMVLVMLATGLILTGRYLMRGTAYLKGIKSRNFWTGELEGSEPTEDGL